MRRISPGLVAGVLASLVASPPPAAAQAPTDSTFDQRARAAWLAVADLPDELRDDTLPLTIARLAGLDFEAQADRLTPDLDSALALSVMSGGALRESPWGWFALARQLQHRRGSCREADRDLWNSHCRRVFDAWREAMQRDSGFAPVLAEVMEAVPWPLLWSDPEVEFRHLDRALGQLDLPARVRQALERTRILLAVDFDLDSLHPRELLLRGGSMTPGESDFLLSRVLARQGRPTEALESYVRSADDRRSGQHLEWIRGDIVLIGSEEEVTNWDSLAPDARERWIREFWEQRDLESGRGPGERLREHAERWQVALRDYRAVLADERMRIPPAGSRPGDTCLSGDSTAVLGELVLGCNFQERNALAVVFDDRGLAYLRHGPPQRKANYPGLDHFTLESWLYAWPGELAVIHFDRGDNPALPYGMRKQVVQARGDPMATCQVAPRYCTREAQHSMGIRIAPEVNRLFVERSREQMDRILTTDGAPQRFANAFSFNAGAYALGSAPRRVTLAVEAHLEPLRKLITTDSSRIALRWQVRIRSRDGKWPVSSDTVQSVALPARARGDNNRYLTLVREFAVPPGTYDLRLVLSDSAGTTGAMYSRDGVVVIGGATPNLSDLVLMPDGNQGAARTIEGQSVRISPTFTPGSARDVQLGYVLTGLADRDVRVTVEVTEAGKVGETPRISVTFPERPDSDREFRTQRLGLERLGNGAWDLSVSVLLPDGTTVTRTQRMVVRR